MSESDVFVTICNCRAKAGRERTVFDLLVEWQRERLAHAKGYLSGELFTNAYDPQEFFAIARFESEAVAWAAIEDSAHYAWSGRLAALVEKGPIVTHYHCVLPVR